MSKEEYLNQLHKYLRKLPKQDYDDAMDYFEEYFQETDEAGAQKLIEEMGTPKEAARELIANLLDKKMDEAYICDENNDRMETSGKNLQKEELSGLPVWRFWRYLLAHRCCLPYLQCWPAFWSVWQLLLYVYSFLQSVCCL